MSNNSCTTLKRRLISEICMECSLTEAERRSMERLTAHAVWEIHQRIVRRVR